MEEPEHTATEAILTSDNSVTVPNYLYFTIQVLYTLFPF